MNTHVLAIHASSNLIQPRPMVISERVEARKNVKRNDANCVSPATMGMRDTGPRMTAEGEEEWA